MKNLYEKRKFLVGFDQAGGTLKRKWWQDFRKYGKNSNE
jgi:hypothetical protein